MMNNISILTGDQLGEAVDLVLEGLDELCIDLEDVSDVEITQAANEVGVYPSPQVVSATLSRIEALL